jgi:hypothetical protein
MSTVLALLLQKKDNLGDFYVKKKPKFGVDRPAKMRLAEW